MGLRYIFAVLISIVAAICCFITEWLDGMAKEAPGEIKEGAGMKIPRGFTKKQWLAILEEMDDDLPAPPPVDPPAPAAPAPPVADPDDAFVEDLFDLDDDEIVEVVADEPAAVAAVDSDDEDFDLASLYGDEEGYEGEGDPFRMGDDDAVVAAFVAPGRNAAKNRRRRANAAAARAARRG